jgi:hypothetical protein
LSRPPPSSTRASTTTTSTCTGHLHQPLGTAAGAAHGAPLRASLQIVFVRAVSFPGLLSRSIFVIIAKNFTDHDAMDLDLRVTVHAMAHTALPSV